MKRCKNRPTRLERNHGAYGGCSRKSTLSRCLPLLLTLSLTLPLLGCGSSYKLPPVTIDPVEVVTPPAKPQLPAPDPMKALTVDWIAVQTLDGLILGLTPEQFENLMTNLAEILRWIQEAGWRLDYYGRQP